MMRTPPIGFTPDNFCAVVRAADPSAKDIKTETRRLLTLPNTPFEFVNELKSFCQDGDGNWIGWSDDSPNHAELTKNEYPKGSNKGIKPKYQVGDRCYLTEPTQIVSAPDQSFYYQVEYFWHKSEVLQKLVTNDDIAKILERKSGIYSKQNQRFMLKSFARYHIEITKVKLERLHDITTEGAIAEGIKVVDINPSDNSKLYLDYMDGGVTQSARISYLSEIAAIHKPSKGKIGGWDLVNSNPWMWVYKFKLANA